MQELLTCLPEQSPSGSSLTSTHRLCVSVLEHSSNVACREPLPFVPLLQMKNDFTGFVVVLVRFSSVNAGTQRNPELYNSVCAAYQLLHWHQRLGQTFPEQTAKGQHKEKNRIILMQCQLTVVVKKCLMRCQQGGMRCFPQDKSNYKICVESSNTKQLLPNLHPVLAIFYIFREHLKETIG